MRRYTDLRSRDTDSFGSQQKELFMAITLEKNKTLSLKKVSSAIAQITLGLGWDPASAKKGGFFSGLLGGGGGDIDLDASLILLDANRNVVDKVWFRKLKSNCGSVIHTGDNRTGHGDGDDEQIRVNLERLPNNVEYIVATVNSFTGQTFNDVENCYCRITDQNNQELVKYSLKEQSGHKAVIIASMARNGGDWEFKALGEFSSGQTVDALIPQAQALVG